MLRAGASRGTGHAGPAPATTSFCGIHVAAVLRLLTEAGTERSGSGRLLLEVMAGNEQVPEGPCSRLFTTRNRGA